MNKIHFIVLVVTTFVLAGCIDLQKEEQLKRIDQLSFQLDSVQVLLQDQEVENLDDINEMIKDIDARIQLLGDTISVDLAVLIDHYKITANTILPLQSIHRYIDTNSQIVESNLKDLKNDIEQAYGKRGKYNEFIDFELQKVDSLKMYMDSLNLLKSTLLEGVEKYFSTLNDELKTQELELGMNVDNND